MTNRLRHLLILTLLSVLLGCGEGVHVLPHQQPEQPIATKDAVWQQAWVDPSVVYSDSIFTLIRADRIDSFLVAPGKLQPEVPDLAVQVGRGGVGAIKFQVASGVCHLDLNLLGGPKSLAPNFPTQLPAGYYKLTCDLTGVSSRQFPAGSYQLEVKYCGQSKFGSLTRKRDS